MNQHRPGTGAPVTQNRRRVLQTAVALATMAATGDYQRARATRGWCRSDPFIAIQGVVVDIFCTAPLEAPLYVTGPTEIVVSVPVGVSATLVLAGVGFGRGERVTFDEAPRLKQSATGVELEVRVYVPADRKLPIGVEFARNLVGIITPTRAEGVTNQWITLGKSLEVESLLAQQSSSQTPLALESSDRAPLALESSRQAPLAEASGQPERPERRARDRRVHPRRKRQRQRH